MKILMLLKGPIDNDSRVKKEITSLAAVGHDVSLVSMNGAKLNGVAHHIFRWRERRIFLPGLSTAICYFRFLIFAAQRYGGERVIHAHDLNTLPVAVFLKFINRAAHVDIIYDSHEFAANDVPYESELTKKLKYLNERLWIRWCRYAITVSDSIANEYVSLYNISKPVVIHNCPIYQSPHSSNRFRDAFGIQAHERIFLYQGAFTKGRGIEALLDVFSNERIANSVIVFMGYGELTEQVQQYATCSANIFYHQAVSQDVLLEYTSSADVGLSLIENSCISYNLCLPNKVFEYVMAGLPLVASRLPELSALIEEYNIGLLCEFNDIGEIVTTLNEAAQIDLSRFAENLDSVRDVYNWDREFLKLAGLYESVTRNDP